MYARFVVAILMSIGSIAYAHDTRIPDPCATNDQLPQCKILRGEQVDEALKKNMEILRDGKLHQIIVLTRSQFNQIGRFNLCAMENALLMPQCLETNEDGSPVIRLIEDKY